MKKFALLSVMAFMVSSASFAQDDIYFTPKKKDKVKAATVVDIPENTYYSGSDRDVDEYNRRGLSSYYQVLGSDSLGNDTIVVPAGTDIARLISSAEASGNDDDDYAYSRRMSRFDDFYWYNNPWDYPYYCSYYWSSRWGWYDPWYTGWYGPWYGGWHHPWYVGWYDPWYDGWYPHYHRPVWVVNNRPAYGGLTGTGHRGSFNRGTGTHRGGSFGNNRGNNRYNKNNSSDNWGNNRNNSFGNRNYQQNNTPSYSSPSHGGSFGGSHGGSFSGGSRGGGSFGGGSHGGNFGRRR